MKVIQNTYGTAGGAAAQLKQPIISIAAGYHRFFAITNRNVLTEFTESGATLNPLKGKYVPLFKSSKANLKGRKSGPSKTVQYGDYRGNYILYKYIAEHDLKQLNREMDLSQYPKGNSTEGVDIIDRALQNITQRMNAEGEEIVTTKGLRSAEEQGAAVELKGQKKYHKDANPVDLTVGKDHYQVTYTKEYERLSGHSIHGQKGLGKTLKSNIVTIRKEAEDTKKGKHKMYEKISKEGLSYFQKRLPMWNNIMRQVQGDVKMTGGELRSHIKAEMFLGQYLNYGQNVEGIAMKGFKGTLHGSTGFFNKAASQMTMQALGNTAKYQEGVFNVTTMDAGVHSLVGLFMLTADPVWRYKEDEMNQAHVSYGLDATTPIIASKFSGLNSLHINQMRSHAQQLVDARVTLNTGKVGEMMSTEAARHLSGGVRLLPSINIKTANKELSSWVINNLLPRISTAASSAARTSREGILGQGFIDRSTRMGKANFTALPYLSIFDSVLSRYGKK